MIAECLRTILTRVNQSLSQYSVCFLALLLRRSSGRWSAPQERHQQRREGVSVSCHDADVLCNLGSRKMRTYEGEGWVIVFRWRCPLCGRGLDLSCVVSENTLRITV